MSKYKHSDDYCSANSQFGTRIASGRDEHGNKHWARGNNNEQADKRLDEKIEEANEK